MGKLVNIAPLADKELKLQDAADYLEELKDVLIEIIDEYESEDADSEKIDILTDALDALEDACDAINDVVMDELYERGTIWNINSGAGNRQMFRQ